MIGEGDSSATSRKQKPAVVEGEANPPAEQEDMGGKKHSTDTSLHSMISSDSRFVLKGWPLIEEWMTKLDERMVRDFHEDINTLLTFAGLFSAVVTAFLIQLYLGLQPDSNQMTSNLLTQTTSLLSQISQQLANSSIIPVDIPTPSPIFQASGFTIWITTLWFLSLILSLAAALFGMISKQWLRAYLQWTTMSGPSENQVALRQARYDAFMDWKTPAIISSMPVLLEIALIVFLLGLEGLLWTLNAIVFSVCTVAVASLIMMVIVATVLPVYRAWCPYKSPVGWAVILVTSALSSFWKQSLVLVRALLRGRWYFLSIYRSRHRRHHSRPHVVEKDWCAWDLARQRWTPRGNESFVSATALGRHRMLTRALWWIRENSQDQRLIDAADEGLASRVRNPSFNAFKVLVADVYFACEHLGINSTHIVPPESQCANIDAGACVIQPGVIPLLRYDVRYFVRLASDDQWRQHELRLNAPHSVLAATAHLLASDLLTVITHYNEEDMQCFGRQADYFLQASGILTVLLACYATFPEMRPSMATNRFVELVDRLCCHYATLPLRLKPLLLLLVKSSDEWESQFSTRLAFPSATAFSHTRHALNTPPGRPDSWSKAECCIFLCISHSALREWRTTSHDHNTAKTLLPRLFYRMSAFVCHCRNMGWKDCAVASHEFRWPDLLKELFVPEAYHISGRRLPDDFFPHDLIDTLQQYSDAGFITYFVDSSKVASLVKRSRVLKGQRTSQDQADDVACGLESEPQNVASVHAQPSPTVSPQLATDSTTLHPSHTVTYPVNPTQYDEHGAESRTGRTNTNIASVIKPVQVCGSKAVGSTTRL